METCTPTVEGADVSPKLSMISDNVHNSTLLSMPNRTIDATDRTTVIAATPFTSCEVKTNKQDVLTNFKQHLIAQCVEDVSSNVVEEQLPKYFEDDHYVAQQEIKENFQQTDNNNQCTFATPEKPSLADIRVDGSSAVDGDSDQLTKTLFKGLKFRIVSFVEEHEMELKRLIESHYGKVVSQLYKGTPDYLVLPVFSSGHKQVAKHVVTAFWILYSIHNSEILPVEYFYRPIAIQDDVQPLNNCIVSISNYTDYERIFLNKVIVRLGGISQERFSRITCVKSNVLACTHLVSPEASGKKYKAAIKWGLPVLYKDWLLECARLSRYALEDNYLVGKAKCSARSKAISESSTLTGNSSPKVSCRKPDPSHQTAGLTNATVRQLNESFYTPARNKTTFSSSEERTAVNRRVNDVQNISGVCSQITPVRNIIAEARRKTSLGASEHSLPRPNHRNHVDTPETPSSALIKDNVSPNTSLQEQHTKPKKDHRTKYSNIHKTPNKFTCDICNCICNRSDILLRHIRRKHGNHAKLFFCEICNLAFHDNYSLNKHMHKHDTNKEFECDICQKKFTYKDSLRRHKKNHTKQKSYKCKMCNINFSRKDSLKKHMISITHSRACDSRFQESMVDDDDTQNIANNTMMQAKCLESVKCPVLNTGTFKNPERPRPSTSKSHLLVDDVETANLTDNDCVQKQGLQEKHVMSDLKIREEIIKSKLKIAHLQERIEKEKKESKKKKKTKFKRLVIIESDSE